MAPTQRELKIWLKEYGIRLTAEQFDRFLIESEDIATRFRDEDGGAHYREIAMQVTVRALRGEPALLEDAHINLIRSRIEARDALVIAQQAARMAVLDGTPEAVAAREAGIDRMTLRKVLGKS